VPPQKIGKKYFSGNCYVKFGHFSGKNHIKFPYFDNFSGKNHVKFTHFVNYSYTFFGQKCLVRNVTHATQAHLVGRNSGRVFFAFCLKTFEMRQQRFIVTCVQRDAQPYQIS